MITSPPKSPEYGVFSFKIDQITSSSELFFLDSCKG